MHKAGPTDVATITVAAADPMNLVDIVVPGKRASAISGRVVTYLGGKPEAETPATPAETVSPANHPRTRSRPARHATMRNKLIQSNERSGHGSDSHPDRSRQERLFPG
jgi:hypothetical protein